jgi:hypothetical protein
VAVVEEIGVVYEDLDRVFSSAKQVPPVCQAEDKSQEFSIPDIIIVFSCIEGFGGVSDHMSFSSFILLK